MKHLTPTDLQAWLVAITDTRATASGLLSWLSGPLKDFWIDTVRPPKFCRVVSPGFKVQWELMKEDGRIVARHALDSAYQESGGTYSAVAITRTLSGFSDQPLGQYRLRISVVRDAKELEFLNPHILVGRPFFSPRSIE